MRNRAESPASVTAPSAVVLRLLPALIFAARIRAVAHYKDFLPLWKDADIPILKEGKPNT